eukprot:GHVO01000457.1.p1 GENE.GHVO01000457.1~~GHVO01000457.1.p1  ORF type:complete len:153 (+),score=28.04 GHVO01000457.1:66-524(+)
MEKIEKFEIQLDLADCELVYDYVTREELRRPTSGFWSPMVFEGKGSLKPIPVNDEGDRTRISLMDSCIMDTVFMEKKVVEDKAKDSPPTPPKEEEEEEDEEVKDADALKATNFPAQTISSSATLKTSTIISRVACCLFTNQETRSRVMSSSN